MHLLIRRVNKADTIHHHVQVYSWCHTMPSRQVVTVAVDTPGRSQASPKTADLPCAPSLHPHTSKEYRTNERTDISNYAKQFGEARNEKGDTGIIQHDAQRNLSSCRAKYTSTCIAWHHGDCPLLDTTLAWLVPPWKLKLNESGSYHFTTTTDERSAAPTKNRRGSVYWPPLQGIIYFPSNIMVINI